MITVYKVNSVEDAIIAAKDLTDVVSVEAEFGENYYGVKDGASVELLHHGKHSENYPTAISFYKKFPKLEYSFDNFIVSHIDIDTIFGIMWAAGFLKKTRITIELSELIAEVDKKGFHWFIENKLNDLDEKIKHKYLAIGKIISSWKFPNTNKGISDYSKVVHKLILKIKDIIIFDVPEEIIQENIDFLNNYEKNNLKNQENAFIEDLSIPGLLLVYKSNSFLLGSYTYKNLKYPLIIQYNTGSNTISISSNDEKLTVELFGETGVQKPLIEFFGKDSGGHKLIGGSPRDFKLQDEYLEAFVKFLKRNYFNIVD